MFHTLILDSCTAPGFWQTLFSIAEVKKIHCSEIESCKSKPMDQKFQQPGISDEAVATEAMILSFIKGRFI